jgi:hypothetical protein
MIKLVVALGATVFLVGCWAANIGQVIGMGPMVSRSYDVQGFKLVKISGNFACDVSYGDQQSVVVEAQENIYQYLNVHSNGQRLKVGIKIGSGIRTDVPIKVTIVMPKPLDQVSLSGAVFFKLGAGVQSHLRARASGACNINTQACIVDDVDVSLSGSCEALVAVNKHLHASLAGASTLGYTGQADEAHISLSGSATINGDEAKVQAMTLKASGAADVQVNVQKSLDIDASGTASIVYSGTPVINQKGYGVVKVHQK